MMTELSAWMRSLQSQLASNARLRAGIQVVAVILAAYLVLVVMETRQRLVTGLEDAKARLERLQSLAGQTEWPQRAEAARRLRDGLEAEIPSAPTLGSAQADVQGWMREINNAFNDSLRLQAQSPAEVDGSPGLWRIPLQVSGSLEPHRLLQLVQRLESRSHLVFIEQIAYTNSKPYAFSLTAIAIYRVGAVDGATD